MLTSSISATNGICFLNEPSYFEFTASLDASSPNYKVSASYFVIGQAEPFFRQNFTTSADGIAKVYFNSILKANFNATKELPEIKTMPETVAQKKYKIVVKETLLGVNATEEIDDIEVINGTDSSISSDIWTCGRFLNSDLKVTSKKSSEYLYLYGYPNTYPVELTLYFEDQTTETLILSSVSVDGLTLIPVDYISLSLATYEVGKIIESYKISINGVEADFIMYDVHDNFLVYQNRFGLWETMNFKFLEQKVSKKQDTFDSEEGLEVTNLVFEKKYFCQSPPYFEGKNKMIDFLRTYRAFVFMDNKFQKIIITSDSDTLEMDSPDFDPHFNFEFILSKQK